MLDCTSGIAAEQRARGFGRGVNAFWPIPGPPVRETTCHASLGAEQCDGNMVGLCPPTRTSAPRRTLLVDKVTAGKVLGDLMQFSIKHIMLATAATAAFFGIARFNLSFAIGVLLLLLTGSYLGRLVAGTSHGWRPGFVYSFIWGSTFLLVGTFVIEHFRLTRTWPHAGIVPLSLTIVGTLVGGLLGGFGCPRSTEPQDRN